MDGPFRLYIAGEMFDHKHLSGNALLAEALRRISRGSLIPLLPQDIEHTSFNPEDIRNADLKCVIESDLILFNFDGPDLDSGTVVEFMLAKFLDIPAVVLRSDFRSAGDQVNGEKWNLMCSFYPRTVVLTIDALAWYKSNQTRGAALPDVLSRAYEDLATQVYEKTIEARRTPSGFHGNIDVAKHAYLRAIESAGSLVQLCNSGWIDEILTRKAGLGLL